MRQSSKSLPIRRLLVTALYLAKALAVSLSLSLVRPPATTLAHYRDPCSRSLSPPPHQISRPFFFLAAGQLNRRTPGALPSTPSRFPLGRPPPQQPFLRPFFGVRSGMGTRKRAERESEL
ncbi:uncharacterized protein BDZ83DRAFT_467003 [Colletotrichum acutatum]|uniref:Uncharacterized protein n=1 Tax=Glomerella acutata TaxID=27357 RepID=A0AAD8UGQ5_GLOAC|nr:uncharacterized protein BDZ83DRAFT_467003 [Colletotrichum acutatum]KAK1718793.1 hypothetical protein BDZ83DRAFT_467003 [Colletotrichum acutatum]